MCMQTTNRIVRDFLICELQKMGEFNAEEESAIEFIRHFEKLYPKHSFEEATLKSIERQTEHWKEPMAVISISLEGVDDDEPPQSSLAVDASLEDHDHTHLPLECVQLWDKKTRERILFERIIQLDCTVPDLIPEEHISMVSAWEFLTSRADWKQIQNWIKASFPLAEEDTALEMPIKHPLETCVANQLELTPDFMKDWILDELATRGVFSSNEIQDFDKLLKRLSRIYRVISLPHPLSMGRMQVDMTDFCNQFVSFCVKRNLCSVLYEFLDNMDLCQTVDDVTELDLPIEECPWLHMMLHFRWVGKYLSDPSYMFQTSLACSRVFMSSFQPSVMSLLGADRPLAAMATLMYAPGTLEQAMTGPVVADESLWKVDAKVLENSLKPYRTLHSTLFPNHVDGVPVQDVSVYDLLQAYSPFDVSKLFLWQSTNNVAIREEDQRYKMPQFSDSDLVSKYGHKEDLDFTYYLKQGRPSFAFTSFVEHQIELGGTSKKRISQAQAKACLIALKHFANQGIASACVAFIEMLGRDSTRLRVDLQTGNTIYNFQQKEEEWRKQDKQHWQEWLLNAEKKIAGNLLCAFRKHGKRSSELLIRLLESAISNKMVKTNKSSCSLEAAREWDVAVMFCRFHRLPLTDVYLRDCAKHDEWLCFTVFAQQHHYPKEHVLELVQTFKSTSLTEHLSLAFENPVYGSSFLPTGQHGYTTQSSVTKKKSIVRDHRTTYLFKVGFDSGKNGEEDSTDDDEEADNFDDEYQHMSEHSESQFQDLVLENVPSDLFGVILACQSSPHPAKMLLAYSAIFKQPSLAVLSACFSNSDQLNCLCMFLMTSMKDEDVFMVTGNEIALLQWHQWNLDELMSIVRITMETGKSLILCKAFQVFQPASPLTSYLEFTCAYLVKSDEALAAVHLKNFHHKYLEIVENSDNLQETNTTSVTDINNLKFLEKAVSELTLLSFKSCCNFAATCRLLKLMAGLHFSGKFSNPVANYTKLYELSMIIKSTSVQLDIGRLLTGDGSVFHKHCQEVLEKLQAVKDFTSAKKFAIAAGLNMDHVVINQLKDELKKLKNNTQWNSTTVRELFWQKCNKELKSTKTSNKAAFQFFRSIASDVSLNLSTGEKIVILCLALEWLGKVTASTSPTYVGLEQDIWRLRVDLEIEKIKNGNKCHSPVDKVFISKPRSSHDIPGSGVKYRGSEEFLYLADYELIGIQPMKTADITVALNKIVKELLDSFCIIQAHKVCQQFSFFSQDLAVVLTCIRLARTQLRTEDLSTDMKMLLARGKRKRLSLSESVSSANRTYSFSSLSSVSEVDESDEILTCLETFCEHSNDGARCCNRITNCYKVSQILNYTYEDIVTQSSIETLKIILQSNMPQQFLAAKEFIQTTCMNDADVSSFLADMIIKQVTLKAEQQQQGHALDSQVPLSRKPSDKDELTKFIKLCQNPATLGNRLIQEAKALLDNPSASKIAHTLQVELIIRAHDCHTICCNMEGISSVLRLCRDCTQVLGKAEEHRLMIRLIMGVGRCSEMMYTFEYLHKAKKLEHLIKIGSKDGKLKIALLDYLKRCKPPDPETYNMVSFKFRMHREIGEMLEKDAMKSLKALADRAMETNIELQNCLQEILQGLTEAAQNYAKENCLRHAEYCTCQARLVALQLHLLSTNTRVINLDSNEFHKFITKHGKFHEALLVASAYSDQHVKWSNALYYNVIQQGNFVFLDDFKRSLRLEESHFTDMSSRYKHDQEKTPEMRENMKRLVGYCRDLKTAYDMATELNFQDIAMDMLKGDGGSYLRDII
ncbi:spatacsin-like isoform X2 [Antedon mediterranea]|uniref:spatacsin-like isoform X2 n=1 Tax=Antedon mediterranea TaxID=105859 RepID=UPI003AF935BB